MTPSIKNQIPDVLFVTTIPGSQSLVAYRSKICKDEISFTKTEVLTSKFVRLVEENERLKTECREWAERCGLKEIGKPYKILVDLEEENAKLKSKLSKAEGLIKDLRVEVETLTYDLKAIYSG